MPIKALHLFPYHGIPTGIPTPVHTSTLKAGIFILNTRPARYFID